VSGVASTIVEIPNQDTDHKVFRMYISQLIADRMIYEDKTIDGKNPFWCATHEGFFFAGYVAKQRIVNRRIRRELEARNHDVERDSLLVDLNRKIAMWTRRVVIVAWFAAGIALSALIWDFYKYRNSNNSGETVIKQYGIFF
jgi:hypothetical protein